MGPTLKRFCPLLLILMTALLLPGCTSLALEKGYPQHGGEIQGLPVERSVEVLRDSWGIPHLYAENVHDLLVAQGFVHAQDRLWQMEMSRRLAQGRLSELAGEKTLMVDALV